MTTTAAAFGAFVLSALIYGVVSIFSGQKMKTVEEYFHTNKKFGVTITLILSNLTLGSGLVYMVSLAATQGAWALSAPFGIFVGYLILSMLLARVKTESSGESDTLLDIIRMNEEGEITLLYRGIVILLIIAFTFLLSFETYASAGLFSALLVGEGISALALPIAAAIAIVVLVYTTLGGLRAVIITDVLQMIAVIVMMASLFAVVAFPGVFELAFADSSKSIDSNLDKSSQPILGSVPWIVVIAAFLTAMSTQLYNVANIAMAANFTGVGARVVYLSAGVFVAAGVSVFVCLGLAMPAVSGADGRPIIALLEQLSGANSNLNGVVVFLVLFGMLAIFFSTSDTGLISTAQISYRNLVGWKTQVKSTEQEYFKRRAQWLVVFIGGVGMGIFLVIIDKRPEIVPLLLGSVYGLTVAGPLLATAAYFKATRGRSQLLRTDVGGVALAMVGSMWVIALYDIYAGNGALAPILIVVGVGAGLLWFVIEACWD